MSLKNSEVFAVALSLGGAVSSDITPESAIYGYAKLLLMEENTVKRLISSENLKELDAARSWFAAHGFSLKNIRSWMPNLYGVIPTDKARLADLKSFATFAEETAEASTIDILNQIVKNSPILLGENSIFTEGKSDDDFFALQKSLKTIKEASEEDSPKAEEKEAVEPPKSEPEAESEDPMKDESFDRILKMMKAQSGDSETEAVATAEEEFTERSLSELSKKLQHINACLLDKVVGQEAAIAQFLEGYTQGEILKQTSKGGHPKSYYFFFGPPGVGKTYLAETAANALGLPYKMYSMSEYSMNNSHEDLIGTSPIYGNAKEGDLTEFVKKNPECIIVFDEIEKAHINTIRQFLQILGSGKLTDAKTKQDIDFGKSIIIFTSNVGRELYEDRSLNLTTLPVSVLVDAILKEKDAQGKPLLPPEICSRIATGNTIIFNHLTVNSIAKLVSDHYEKVVSGMQKEYGISLTYEPELPLLFLFNRGLVDARVASRQSENFIKNEIHELIRQSANESIQDTVKHIDFEIDWKSMSPELLKLFHNDEKSVALLFADEAHDVTNAVSSDKYKLIRVATLDEAKNKLEEEDISAVFIDPTYGLTSEDPNSIMSVTDYESEGNKLFNDIIANSGIPVYILDTDRDFTDAESKTYQQSGAMDVIELDVERVESFKRELEQILDELYMENQSATFSQRGFVIEFETRQIVENEEKVRIVFYNFHKKEAVDLDARQSMVSGAEKPDVSFDDIIGASTAKEELMHFVEILKNPKKYVKDGRKMPKGVLLYGPPGTGKTMLAKAMAGESDFYFVPTSASEFKNKWVGESEANIRKVFERAKKYAPSVIFIDEIDAIGKKRTGLEPHDESMLNALLTQMDGFISADPKRPVFVLAATNYGVSAEDDGIAELDQALIRRFDNKIYVALPKEDERKQFVLKMIAKNKNANISEATAQSVAERTTGMSLAILNNIIALAVRKADKEFRPVNDNDLLSALEEYNYGDKKEHSQEYYHSVAIHEMGHAFMSYISGDKPSYITIESRGDFGGYMQHANSEEVTGYTRDEIISKIRTCLAGRAAETVFYGPKKANNTGASSDLQHATQYAFSMLCTYGMEENQLVVLDRKAIMSSPLAADYIAKVNALLNELMAETIAILEANKDKIEELAKALEKDNKLTGAQFDELMAGYQVR